jgi:hypothetical protein
VHEYERWTDPYIQRPGERPLEATIQSKWWERNG